MLQRMRITTTTFSFALNYTNKIPAISLLTAPITTKKHATSAWVPQQQQHKQHHKRTITTSWINTARSVFRFSSTTATTTTTTTTTTTEKSPQRSGRAKKKQEQQQQEAHQHDKYPTTITTTTTTIAPKPNKRRGGAPLSSPPALFLQYVQEQRQRQPQTTKEEESMAEEEKFSWHDLRNHRLFLDWIALQLGISIGKNNNNKDNNNYDAWYKVIQKDLAKIPGALAFLQRHYNTSLQRALEAAYPEHEWLPWKFAQVPLGFWRDPANHRRFLEWAAQKQLGIHHLDDWYRVGTKQIDSLGGKTLLDVYYQGSLQRALAAVYPEHEWLPWRFVQVPAGFWSDGKNQRRFLDWAAEQLGIVTTEGWYQVVVSDIKKLGGGRLLEHYQNSLQRALAAVYPEHEWLPWRFRSAPRGFWKDPLNHRRFFDWAAKELGVKTIPDDWYNVTLGQLEQLLGAGSGLITHTFNSSLQRALAEAYPEHEWLPWRFVQVPAGFWNDVANQRRFFDWAAKQLGVVGLDGWYDVVGSEVARLGGSGLLVTMHGGSLHKALSTAYPEHEWLPWRFQQVPRGFWDDIANHRWFFDWAGKQLGITRRNSSNSNSNSNNDNNNSNDSSWLDGWYAVSKEEVSALGGCRLIDGYYGYSLIRALAAVYPEHQWDPWRFQRCQLPKDEVVDEATLRRYVEQVLAPRFHVEKLEDWYRVALTRVREVEGYFMVLERHGGLVAALSKLYPRHEWDEHRFVSGMEKRTSQRMLWVATRRLFPDEEVLEECGHPALRFLTNSKESSSASAASPPPMITFDVWVPSLSLALEYQGEQHYRDVHVIGGGGLQHQRQRDQDKAEACARAGITLIEVPYYWLNRHRHSSASPSSSSSSSLENDLAATIAATRPDLLVRYPALLEAAKRGNAITTTQMPRHR